MLAETLARALSFAPAIGVTRLAVLTGLDVLGIPVAAAVRPNSRTVAVHQGKGASLDAAKVSALMEAAECFCAEMLDLPLRLGSMDELGGPPETLDVSHLPRCPGGVAPKAARLLWVEGTSLFSGRPVWVPRELVAADFILPLAPGSGVFQATTNGLGAGSTEHQAVLHALCEVIERDAMALWFGAPEASQQATLVDPASVDGPRSMAFLQACAAADVEVTIWDATSDVGLPVFAALLADPRGQVQPELGSACRLDADATLAAALAEAAQARVTTISGARDDLAPAAFTAAAMRARAEAAAAWRDVVPRRAFHGTATAPGPQARRDLPPLHPPFAGGEGWGEGGAPDGCTVSPRLSDSRLASRGGTNPLTPALSPREGRVEREQRSPEPATASIATVLSHLQDAGMQEAAAVTLTRAKVGVPVVRVVVPGLEGPWGEPGGEYVPGMRAARR